MKFRPIFPLLRLLFAAAALMALLPLRAAQPRENGGVKVVVIDAGHGGPKYPGASYRGIHEKDINLQVALKLGKLIERELPQLKVVYTRTTDKQFSTDLNADLQARADIANKAGGDLFISIHANAARSTAARGVETLIMGESEKETRLNEAVLYANNREEFLDLSDQKTAAIIRAHIQVMQATYGQYSEMMARILQKNYTAAGYHSRGFKPQPLKVLYATDMPSILTEIGFMSNPDELTYMTSEKGQQAIAQSLLNAVRDYVAIVGELARDADDAPPSEARPAPAPETRQVPPTPAPQTTPAPAQEQTQEPAREPAQAAASGYTIQLRATTKPISLRSAELKSWRGKVTEYTSPGRYAYKYCYGVYESRAAAAADLKRVRQEFPDAYVVRFAGNRIE